MYNFINNCYLLILNFMNLDELRKSAISTVRTSSGDKKRGMNSLLYFMLQSCYGYLLLYYKMGINHFTLSSKYIVFLTIKT